jgi:hypothetical protein
MLGDLETSQAKDYALLELMKKEKNNSYCFFTFI